MIDVALNNAVSLALSSLGEWITFSDSFGWVIEILVGILALVGVNYTLKYVLRCFRRSRLVGSSNWKEKIDQIVYLPIKVSFGIVGVMYVLQVFFTQFDFMVIADYLPPLRNAGLVGCIAWLLMRWKEELQHAVVLKKRAGQKMVDPGMVYVLGRISSIAIVVIATLIALQLLGLNIVPLIAFGGVGAATLGFAAREVMANFFGGLMLYITRPFIIGDWIVLSEKQIEGAVEEIGWYFTSLRDREKRPIYLPNALFSTALVVNSSRMSHRKIHEILSIRYEDISKVTTVTEKVRETLAAHSRIDAHLPILVFFNTFSEYSLSITVEAYTLATAYAEYLSVKQEVLLKIYEALSACEVQMPYPITTLDVPQLRPS